LSLFKKIELLKLWIHKSLIYKRLMSKICNNVRHYNTTAIWWSFNVKVLYWWRLTIKKLKRFVCKDCLYSTLLINHCVRGSAIVQYECIVISWHNLNFLKALLLIIVKRWHHTNSIAIMSYISNTSSNPWLANTLIRCLLSFSQAERMRTQHSLNS